MSRYNRSPREESVIGHLIIGAIIIVILLILKWVGVIK